MSYIPSFLRNTKPSVTVAIGFFCKESLVLASDSQASDGGSTFQQWNERKVVEIKFQDGSMALLAKSGSINVGNLFQEDFETLAATVAPKSPRAVASIAEQSLKTVRDKLLSSHHHPNFDKDSSRRYLASVDSTYLLAYFYEGKPYIYRLELDCAQAFPSKGNFEAIGCAGNLASFLLSDVNFPEMNFGQCFGLAFYAIEMCKKYDQACGGITQLKGLTPNHQIQGFEQAHVEDCIQAANQADAEMKTKLPSLLVEKYARLLQERVKQAKRKTRKKKLKLNLAFTPKPAK